MEIVIVGAAMPFGPETMKHKSLGGSEAAQLQLGQELKKLGHHVTQFTLLPDEGEPDFIPSGTTGEDGVRYVHIDHYTTFITSTECDLLICARNLELAHLADQAKKKVFWMHDLATHGFAAPQIAGIGWTIDEIWCVSEFHKKQVSEITGYPLDNIRVLRNGCTDIEDVDAPLLEPYQLAYCARPERGLINLVRPGGIMERLPEFNLKVCMYANHPDHMKDFYDFLFQRCQELPNVEMVGSLTNIEVRRLLAQSVAYIYPTQFEETSCIIARECASVGTPFLTTREGALPETISCEGIFYEDYLDEEMVGPNVSARKAGDDAWCNYFAKFVRETIASEDTMTQASAAGMARTDLYWDGVAVDCVAMSQPKPVTDFSRVWSLIEDSDAYAAKALLESIPEKDFWLKELEKRFRTCYPFVYGEITYDAHYKNYYEWVDENEPEGRRDPFQIDMGARFQQLDLEVSKLPAGASIIDYGCAEGTIMLQMAQRHPDKNFTAVDFAASNIVLATQYAADHGLTNVQFYFGSSDNWPEALQNDDRMYDAGMCSEVLEHVEEPWKMAQFVENKVKPGGRVILTVPYGPWEAIGLYDTAKYFWRAHVWHIDKQMLRVMFGEKPNPQMVRLPNGIMKDGKAVGHTTFAYDADHIDIPEVGALWKALDAPARETVTACIIAKDCANSIGKMLDTLSAQVQAVQIAVGPCKDRTEEIIVQFAQDNPWVIVNMFDVPAIEARQFGFDDARNESVKDIPSDWILWIDTDEFLVGDMRMYVRKNAIESYSLHQHHFSVEPRGAGPQIDRPARLYRTGLGFEFHGKIHEHAEKGMNEGPGYSTLLPSVDIAHMGYENEEVRRGRFFRNFPFLEWDREVNPDRSLGAYLWLRDIVHRMRYCHETGDPRQAQQLALETIDFYEENWEKMEKFGNGVAMSVGYYGEAMRYLGRGLPLTVDVKLGDNRLILESHVEDPTILTRVIDNAVGKEMDKRKSKYWS